MNYGRQYADTRATSNCIGASFRSAFCASESAAEADELCASEGFATTTGVDSSSFEDAWQFGLQLGLRCDMGLARVRNRLSASGEGGVCHDGRSATFLFGNAQLVQGNAVEANHAAIHTRRREEITGCYGKTPPRLGIQPQLHRIRPICLRPRTGHHAVPNRRDKDHPPMEVLSSQLLPHLSLH